MKERLKNEMGDFIIDGRLSIKELYELAKSEGYEDRTLFFSIKNTKTDQHFSTHHVVDFGEGWTQNTTIMHLTWDEDPEYSKCMPDVEPITNTKDGKETDRS